MAAKQSTEKRSKWMAPLAKAIGWKPQRLRYLFNKHNYVWPYTSELRGLQILAAEKIDIRNYRPTEDAVGKRIVFGATLRPANGGGEATKEAAPPIKPSVPTPAPAESKRGWSNKLLSRLARLTKEGDTPKGKYRVKALLKKADITGRLKEEDEARALAALEKQGIDISKFEYAGAPGEPGGPLFGAPSDDYDTLVEQYRALGERLKKALEEQSGLHARITETEHRTELVRRILRSYERAMCREIDKGIYPGFTKPLGYPLQALDEIR
jgi:hypothetical protein